MDVEREQDDGQGRMRSEMSCENTGLLTFTTRVKAAFTC
jgi:hypothetical protein